MHTILDTTSIHFLRYFFFFLKLQNLLRICRCTSLPKKK